MEKTISHYYAFFCNIFLFYENFLVLFHVFKKKRKKEKIDLIVCSHRRCSVKNGVLRNFAKFTGKHMCHRLFFNKVASLRPATLLRKSLWHRCFPVNFAKFLSTPFLQNTSWRLLLKKQEESFGCKSGQLKKGSKDIQYSVLSISFICYY